MTKQYFVRKRYDTLHYSTVSERYDTLHVLFCTNPGQKSESVTQFFMGVLYFPDLPFILHCQISEQRFSFSAKMAMGNK